MSPSYTVKELMGYQQLLERGFWEAVEYPELGCKITHPGPFCLMSESPLLPPRRAPLLGENNEKIYIDELGFSHQDLSLLKEHCII